LGSRIKIGARATGDGAEDDGAEQKNLQSVADPGNLRDA